MVSENCTLRKEKNSSVDTVCLDELRACATPKSESAEPKKFNEVVTEH